MEQSDETKIITKEALAKSVLDSIQFYTGDFNAEKLQAAEKRVEEAAQKGDHKDTFHALKRVIAAATFGGYPDKALAAFVRCLSMCDTHPMLFSDKDLLIEYKWVVHCLAFFPSIPRAEIEATCERMAKCYVRNGAGLRAVHAVRTSLCIDMGELQEAEKWQARRDELPRDERSDCPSCELSNTILLLALQGKDIEALDSAKPILDGTMALCGTNGSKYALASLLLPCVRTSRMDDALRYHQQGYPQTEGKLKCLGPSCDHLVFMTLRGDFQRALRALEVHLPIAMATANRCTQLQFWGSAWFLTEELILAGHDNIQILLPETIPLPRTGGHVETNMLSEWLKKRAVDLACAFDRRNGNLYQQQTLENFSALGRYRCPDTGRRKG